MCMEGFCIFLHLGVLVVLGGVLGDVVGIRSVWAVYGSDSRAMTHLCIWRQGCIGCIGCIGFDDCGGGCGVEGERHPWWPVVGDGG